MSSPAFVLFSIYNWMIQLIQEVIVTQVTTSFTQSYKKYEQTQNDNFTSLSFTFLYSPCSLSLVGIQ